MKRARYRAPLPVTALILSFLCPTELSLFVAGLRLPPHRVVLIVLLPLALWRLATSRGIRLRGFDMALIAFNAWTLFVFAYHSGGDGIVFGGSLAVESLGAYLVARVFVRDIDAMRATLRIMLYAIGLAALLALPETLLGQIFTHDVMKALTGYVHPTGIESRAGLTRAYGPFDHPIHYGTFCAALLACVWYGERRTGSALGKGAAIGGATFLGLSSAPLLCLAVQAGLIAWERLTRGVPRRLLLSVGCVAGIFLGVSLVATRSPFTIIATGFTFDAWTGFYRTQIWANGMASVAANWATGIGLAEWERPSWMVSSTIDAFWLVIMVRMGLPALLLLAGALLVLARAVLRKGSRAKDHAVRRLATGWLISLTALMLIGCTVHFWNVLHAFFFFFVGLGGWLADPRKAKRPAPAGAQPVVVPPLMPAGYGYAGT